MTILRGVRVLAVEDEPLLLLELTDVLSDLGCHLAGSAGRLDEALEKAATLPFDVAILDVNLAGERISPVVAVLQERSIPHVFLTGYGQSFDPCAVVVEKPCQPLGLERAICRALGLTNVERTFVAAPSAAVAPGSGRD